MYRQLSIAVALVLAAAAAARAEVKLTHKVAENSKQTKTQVTKSHQVLSLAGMDLETRTNQTVVSKVTTGERKADGTIEQTEKVESLKAKLELPGGIELDFDSAKPVEPQGTAADFLLELMEAASKAVSTVVYDKQNRVVSVKVDEEPFKDLPDAAQAIVKGMFDAVYLKKAANRELDRVPSKPLKEGETWELTQDARIGAGQTFTVTTGYKYEGTIEKEGRTLDRITFSAGKIDYSQEAQDSPVKVTDSDLKIKSSEGEILFDRELGQIVSVQDKMHVTGELTIDANGQELPAELDLTMEQKTTR